MKKYIIITFAVFASLLLVLPSCSDSFLDVNPEASLSTDMAIGNVADARVALSGVYDGMQSTAFYYGRNFVVIPDIAGDDVKVSTQNSGRFLTHYNFSTIPSDGFLTDFWNRAWNTINRANNIVNKIGNITDGTEADRNQILGEALTLRALAHFDLARIFATPYAVNANALAIPYMEEAKISSPTRETNQVVYGKIVTDLNNAIGLMTLNRPATFVSKNAAKALLARVYLYMENFDMAAQTAIDVINTGGYTLMTNANYVAGWSAATTTESIFSLAMSNIDYSATDALGYIYIERGYGDLLPTDEIKDLIKNAGNTAPGADVRFTAFFKDEGAKGLYINKYPGRGGQSGLDNTPVIRLSEMYLIAAEALVRKANPSAADITAARGYLNTIVKRGNSNAADIALAGNALLERIYLEKRIEFAFEGHRFFDIGRRKEDLIRGSDCTASFCVVEVGNFRRIFPIPQREINANGNMVQNPGYGQ
jgi:starch-binding outer membrane protein, SusD/RagB family